MQLRRRLRDVCFETTGVVPDGVGGSGRNMVGERGQVVPALETSQTATGFTYHPYVPGINEDNDKSRAEASTSSR